VVQPNGTSWDKLEYVGQVGQGEGGLQILVGPVGQGEGGLQIFVGQVGQGQGVCPLEPVHLSQMGLQGRESFHRYRRWVDCFFIDRSICHGRYRQSMLIHLLENTVDVDGRCRITYSRIRSISTVDADSPT